MEIHNSKKDKIATAIKGILEELLNRLKKDDYPAIPFSELTSMVNKYNRDNVLNHLDFIESRDRLKNAIIANKDVSGDIHKMHFIENNFLKGIALIQESEEVKIRTYSESPNISIPVLDVDALEYRYNNDKETYISG